MEDPILERRLKIEAKLKTPEYQKWIQYRNAIREGHCFFYNPIPDASGGVCASCTNNEFCAYIEKEPAPLIPLVI